MKFSVEHLGLPARDPQGLKDWYVATLDGKVVFQDGKTPPAFFVALPGDILIEICPGDFALEQTADKKLNGWRHVALLVDSHQIGEGRTGGTRRDVR